MATVLLKRRDPFLRLSLVVALVVGIVMASSPSALAASNQYIDIGYNAYIDTATGQVVYGEDYDYSTYDEAPDQSAETDIVTSNPDVDATFGTTQDVQNDQFNLSQVANQPAPEEEPEPSVICSWARGFFCPSQKKSIVLPTINAPADLTVPDATTSGLPAGTNVARIKIAKNAWKWQYADYGSAPVAGIAPQLIPYYAPQYVDPWGYRYPDSGKTLYEAYPAIYESLQAMPATPGIPGAKVSISCSEHTELALIRPTDANGLVTITESEAQSDSNLGCALDDLVAAIFPAGFTGASSVDPALAPYYFKENQLQLSHEELPLDKVPPNVLVGWRGTIAGRVSGVGQGGSVCIQYGQPSDTAPCDVEKPIGSGGDYTIYLDWPDYLAKGGKKANIFVKRGTLKKNCGSLKVSGDNGPENITNCTISETDNVPTRVSATKPQIQALNPDQVRRTLGSPKQVTICRQKPQVQPVNPTQPNQTQAAPAQTNTQPVTRQALTPAKPVAPSTSGSGSVVGASGVSCRPAASVLAATQLPGGNRLGQFFEEGKRWVNDTFFAKSAPSFMMLHRPTPLPTMQLVPLSAGSPPTPSPAAPIKPKRHGYYYYDYTGKRKSEFIEPFNGAGKVDGNGNYSNSRTGTKRPAKPGYNVVVHSE